jgi:hypothetical protein
MTVEMFTESPPGASSSDPNTPAEKPGLCGVHLGQT